VLSRRVKSYALEAKVLGQFITSEREKKKGILGDNKPTPVCKRGRYRVFKIKHYLAVPKGGSTPNSRGGLRGFQGRRIKDQPTGKKGRCERKASAQEVSERQPGSKKGREEDVVDEITEAEAEAEAQCFKRKMELGAQS